MKNKESKVANLAFVDVYFFEVIMKNGKRIIAETDWCTGTNWIQAFEKVDELAEVWIGDSVTFEHFTLKEVREQILLPF